jgi:tripartite-type tricarboxylate transporter receptor subunit TctC
MISFRSFSILMTMTAALLPVPSHAQEAYPTRPIKMVVPFPPGGSVDVVARLLSIPLQEKFGQPIVIENRPGAVGTIGSNAVAKAAPDGYTFLMTIGAHTIVPALMPTIPYDAANDFAMVSLLASARNMLVARPDFAATDLRSLVRIAKAEPGKISYSTAGTGSTTHMMVKMFEAAAGISLFHVPYQGGAASLQAILSNQTDLNAAVSTTAQPMLKAGKLRAFAIVGNKRSSLFPDIPTFNELGYPGVNGDSWIGLMAPAHTRPAILARFQTEIKRLLNTPEIRAKLEAQGLEVVASTPAEFSKQVRDEMAQYSAFVKSANIKIE